MVETNKNMKLYIWYGDEVLRDWTSGQITVLASSLEDALKQIDTSDMYSRPVDEDDFPRNEPSVVIELETGKIPKGVWLTCGGA